MRNLSSSILIFLFELIFCIEPPACKQAKGSYPVLSGSWDLNTNISIAQAPNVAYSLEFHVRYRADELKLRAECFNKKGVVCVMPIILEDNTTYVKCSKGEGISVFSICEKESCEASGEYFLAKTTDETKCNSKITEKSLEFDFTVSGAAEQKFCKVTANAAKNRINKLFYSGDARKDAYYTCGEHGKHKEIKYGFSECKSGEQMTVVQDGSKYDKEFSDIMDGRIYSVEVPINSDNIVTDSGDTVTNPSTGAINPSGVVINSEDFYSGKASINSEEVSPNSDNVNINPNDVVIYSGTVLCKSDFSQIMLVIPFE